MTSGVSEYSADKALDIFEEKLGLPRDCPIALETRAREILTWEPSTYSHLAPEEYGEAALALMQFAFYLQRAVNREQGRVHYAEEQVRKLVGQRLGEHGGSSWEERRLATIYGNAQIAELEAGRVRAQLRLDRIAYLATRVDAVARMLLTQQQLRKNSC